MTFCFNFWYLHFRKVFGIFEQIMAHRTMPILYLNLCGEMLYIIDQRLIDAKTEPEKQLKGKLILYIRKVT